MRIITLKPLLDFALKHPECACGIESWYSLMKAGTFKNFIELRLLFPAVDRVGKLTVFNIGGNKVRLIVAVHYHTQRVYIRHVLTHAEYDLGYWRE
ncbi:MAG: type II toxin-antitoxin system HigB family toxin [Deltaproteobacteria bacterium]|nr:type II toxin-antitoxin system HigB family toxin [Deltaproteobacteria bacterium]